MNRTTVIVIAAVAILSTAALVGCGVKASVPAQHRLSAPTTSGQSTASQRTAVNQPVSPSGDIPDSQVFITFHSSAEGYHLEVPQGWAQSLNGSKVTFTEAYDGLSVNLMKAPGEPNTTSTKSALVNDLKANGRNIAVSSSLFLQISGNSVLRVVYLSNSAPNPVTNKQVRLEENAYFYFQQGKVAELRLWAPKGADNVDQWKRISGSFQWK